MTTEKEEERREINNIRGTRKRKNKQTHSLLITRRLQRSVPNPFLVRLKSSIRKVIDASDCLNWLREDLDAAAAAGRESSVGGRRVRMTREGIPNGHHHLIYYYIISRRTELDNSQVLRTYLKKKKLKKKLTAVIGSDTFVIAHLKPVEDPRNIVMMFPGTKKIYIYYNINSIGNITSTNFEYARANIVLSRRAPKLKSIFFLLLFSSEREPDRKLNFQQENKRR